MQVAHDTCAEVESRRRGGRGKGKGKGKRNNKNGKYFYTIIWCWLFPHRFDKPILM